MMPAPIALLLLFASGVGFLVGVACGYAICSPPTVTAARLQAERRRDHDWMQAHDDFMGDVWRRP